MLGSTGAPIQMDIHIQNASLASQAVGPALNTVEMSASGRTFPDLGHKLLLVKPLGLQKVDSTDSVLGSLADVSAGKGLTTTYTAMIQKAFQPKWWNSNKRRHRQRKILFHDGSQLRSLLGPFHHVL